MANFDTVAEVVSQAARELSLISEDVSDPYAETDPNILLMTSLLTSAGREIIREYQWTQSIAEHAFTTSAGVETYALPADFLRMLNQTGWDRTTRLPLGGPMSPQEWQFLRARLAAVTFRVLFRPLQGTLHVYAGTTVPAGHAIRFEYMSGFWVRGTNATVYSYTAAASLQLTVTNAAELRPGDTIRDVSTSTSTTITSIDGLTVTVASLTGFTAPGTFTVTSGTAGTKDAPTLASDVLLFDTHLMSRALKRAWKREKGFDTTAAEDDYRKALAAVMRDDTPAPTLNLSRRARNELPIGEQSIPLTGFGS